MANAPKASTPKAAAAKPAAPKPAAARPAAPKAAAPKPAPQAAADGPDFVVKELQTSADDAVKLAYGSMTLPPGQFLGLFAKVGEEYLNFVAKRMQAQVSRFTTLAKCTNPEEIAKIEMAFFGKAAQDYAEQFDRVAETTHDAASQTGDAAKPGASSST